MKPVLVSEHQDEAQAFIQEVENDYLSLVTSVIAEIKSLGLTPTETIVRAVLIDGPEILRGKYNAYAERDISRGSTPAAKAQMQHLHSETFTGFLQKLNPLLETNIGGKPVKNPMFQDLIVFDETLTPSLPKEGREKIMEMFKEYVSDPKLLKLRTASMEAAAGMQSFWQAMIKSGYASVVMIDYSASDKPGWMIDKHVLTALSQFLTITGSDGQYVIEARPFNFTNNVEPEINNDHE